MKSVRVSPVVVGDETTDAGERAPEPSDALTKVTRPLGLASEEPKRLDTPMLNALPGPVFVTVTENDAVPPSRGLSDADTPTLRVGAAACAATGANIWNCTYVRTSATDNRIRSVRSDAART